jgi:hypothetical protein
MAGSGPEVKPRTDFKLRHYRNSPYLTGHSELLIAKEKGRKPETETPKARPKRQEVKRSKQLSALGGQRSGTDAGR